MSGWLQELRFAIRVLLKQPGFTITAVVTVALGIGANTAIFSVVNAVLLKPLPFPQAERIMALAEGDKTNPTAAPFSVSLPDYLDWRSGNTVFEDLAITRTDSVTLSDLPGSPPEQITGSYVTANFFKIFGLTAKLGHTLTNEEDVPNGPAVAIISDRLWSRVFQRDPSVVGRVVTLQGRRVTITGILRPGMVWPEESDVWFSFMRRSTIPAWQQREIHPNLYAWGKLKPSVAVEQAQGEMREIALRLEQEYPATNKNNTVVVRPLLDSVVGKYRTNLSLLLVAVALVLLVACANLANLFAARGATRAQEFAVRCAVGASRVQIMRQLLTESLVVALAGGLAGILLAYWGRDLIALVEPSNVSRFHETRIDQRVFAFTMLTAALTSVFFGIWPAWNASRPNLQAGLKSGGHGSSESPMVRRIRDGLVIVDVALTLVLLSSAGLVFKSFLRMQAVSLGFQPAGLTTARIDLPYANYSDRKVLQNFSETVMNKVSQLPGAQQVALAANAPLQQSWQEPFLREGAPPVPPGQEPGAETVAISGDYFAAMGTSLLRGRNFTPRDDASAPRVVIIDQALAEKYFSGEDPVGKRLITDAGDSDDIDMRPFEIVGVAPRMKFHGVETTTSLPVIYFPDAQIGRLNLVLLVRAAIAPSSLEKSLRAIVSSVDPRQPVHAVLSMSSLVRETWVTQRLLTSLLSVFAGLSLILASVGLYGVLAYNTTRRFREFGLRFALGATRNDVRKLIFSQGFRLFALGCISGLLVTIASGHVLQSFLFEVSPVEPITYGAVIVILTLATTGACWLPATRASRIEPAVVLRAE